MTDNMVHEPCVTKYDCVLTVCSHGFTQLMVVGISSLSKMRSLKFYCCLPNDDHLCYKAKLLTAPPITLERSMGLMHCNRFKQTESVSSSENPL